MNNALNLMIREAIGQSYLKGNTFAMDEHYLFVRDAYKEISRTNFELFQFIPYQVIFTNKDVYESAAEMREEVVKSGKIYIYSEWSGHPILTKEQNIISRAVHDVFAHLVCGCPFNFEGEYTSYLEQRKWYPNWVWGVLFAEIPAQTAAYYANGMSHDFSQRAIDAPEAWMKMAEGLKLEDYSHNSVLNMNQIVSQYKGVAL